MGDGYCYSSLGFEAYRLTLLSAIGEPVTASVGLFVGGDGIDLDVKQVRQDGKVYNQPLGNGKLCVNRKGPTVTIGNDLVLTVCHWEYELLGAISGGDVAYDADDRVIGVALPDPADLEDRRFCFEAWSQAIDGEVRGSLAGQAAWHHHIWPMTQWSLGDFKLEDAVAPRVFNGSSTPNDNIGHGPFGDWPDFDNGNVLVDGDPSGPYAVYLDTDVPDAICGANELAPTGS